MFKWRGGPRKTLVSNTCFKIRIFKCSYRMPMYMHMYMYFRWMDVCVLCAHLSGSIDRLIDNNIW